jgi:uncharacterized Zn finger protein
MLMDLGQANPFVLSLMGVSMEQLQRELEMQESHQKLETIGAEDKQVTDRKLWSKWLDQYSKRLTKELEGIKKAEIHEVNLCIALELCLTHFILV